jgi:hypothetical protein
MVVQKHSPLLLAAARLAFDNLHAHWKAEQETAAYVPYDIWTLTGPRVLEDIICVPSPEMWGEPLGLRPENTTKVRFVQEGPDAPIVRYRYHSYNAPGTHWSVRQKTERLFG